MPYGQVNFGVGVDKKLSRRLFSALNPCTFFRNGHHAKLFILSDPVLIKKHLCDLV